MRRAVSATASPPGFLPVRTKLHVHEFRSGLVSRRELVSRLCAASERRLVLVCAPAGWGKTVLLSEWHAAEEARAFAWVSLDRGDDDPCASGVISSAPCGRSSPVSAPRR